MSKLSEEAGAAYVVHCLRLNPMWETDEVLAVRADAHGVTSEQQSSYQRAADEAQRKTELRDRVYELRDNIWKLPLDELRGQLTDLPIQGEPDLQTIAGRLRTILNARVQLPALTQDKRFDGDFFDCFKQVLSGGPRESAAMRERVAASFQDKVLRKRGQRMIKLAKAEVPELYALEEKWLRRLGRQKGGAATSRPAGDREVFDEVSGGVAWYWWVIIVVVLRLIAAMATGGSGNE